MNSRERTQSELDSPAPNMVDTVIRTRSLGVGAEGVPDQYSDGKAARVWEFYIGSRTSRTCTYKDWFAKTLKSHGCKDVLDVACGTGVDSMMLMEEGFRVISSDASDKMLKYALKERWERRKEPVFDSWVIEEANWLTLVEDLETVAEKPKGGFDAVICVGNSFAHLPDFSGELTNQRIALENFKANVKPGGIMVIDHRNYDAILDSGAASTHNVYYNSQCITDIQVSSLAVNGRPTMITLDYMMDMSRINMTKEEMRSKKMKADDLTGVHKFRLSYYPHRLAEFTKLLKSVFGEDCEHKVYADFKELHEEPNPAYYIHVIQTPPE